MAMDQVQKLLTKLFRGIGSELSPRLLTLVENAEWAELQKLRVVPSDYTDARSYMRDAVQVELFRKVELPGDNVRKEEAAVQSFYATEAQCCKTNERLNRFLMRFYEPCEEPVMQFITAWRGEVKRVLGSLPMVLTPRFSGGSTLSDKGLNTTIPDKMSSEITVYEPSLVIWRHAIDRTLLDYDRPVRIVRGNKFFTVPKDSEKYRGCCMESSANVGLQLDVGRLLKERYRKAYQVDLTEAPDFHRMLAQAASIGGHLATIDLSNASDTVAKGLVELLLPAAWFDLLNSLRATHTSIGGRWVRLEKFSSMGNGFTFELETIIFRTMLAALGCSDAHAFGDDLIVESERAQDVLSCLRLFGFTPNTKKTFCEGPFRESCGGDFFEGVPVRAHYMSCLPDEPQHWVSLANGLRRADPDGSLGTRAAWRYCVDQVPVGWRVFGPASLGDLVFYDPEAVPSWRRYEVKDSIVPHEKSCHPIPMWRVKRPIQASFELEKYFKSHVVLAAAVLGTGQRVSPRKSVTGYKDDWVAAWGVGEYQYSFLI